jgi:hypothetical protein
MSTSHRLAAALDYHAARSVYAALIRDYGTELTSPQFVRLWLCERSRGQLPALNLLLGQLAARGTIIDPEIQADANAICDAWAQRKQRRAA